MYIYCFARMNKWRRALYPTLLRRLFSVFLVNGRYYFGLSFGKIEFGNCKRKKKRYRQGNPSKRWDAVSQHADDNPDPERSETQAISKKCFRRIHFSPHRSRSLAPSYRYAILSCRRFCLREFNRTSEDTIGRIPSIDRKQEMLHRLRLDLSRCKSTISLFQRCYYTLIGRGWG